MINFKPVQQNFEFFNIVKPLGASIPLSSGESIKADVVDVLPSGAVVLRIKDGYVTVKTEIPLTKENQLLLKVLELKENILKLQIVDIKSRENQQAEKIRQILGTNPELLVQSFDRLPPQTQKEVINFLQGQLRTFQIDSIPNGTTPESLSLETLKKTIENSGIFFENKLLNLLRSSQEIWENIKTFPEPLKTILQQTLQETNIYNFQQKLTQTFQMILNLKNFQQDSSNNLVDIPERQLKKIAELITETQLDKKVLDLLRTYESISSDLKLEEKLQSAIKTFQELSILTESLYGFLPLRWEGLRFSDFKYKKNISPSGKSYNFIVNLDFEDGKLSFITTYKQEKLYITFFIENKELRREILSKRYELFDSLRKTGLDVEYIEVMPYTERDIEKTI